MTVPLSRSEQTTHLWCAEQHIEAALSNLGLVAYHLRQADEAARERYELAVRDLQDALREEKHHLRVAQIVLERLDEERVAAGEVAP